MKEIFIYSFIVYGLCNILIWGSNLEWWRNLLAKLGTGDYSLHKLFTCFMCLPTWIGPLISYFSYTYGNGVLSPTYGYFDIIWIGFIMDGFIASGVVWIINTTQEWFEGNTPSENNDEEG